MSLLPKLQTRGIRLAAVLTLLVATAVLSALLIQLIASYQSEKDTLIDTTLTLNYSNAHKIAGTIDSLFTAMRGSLKTTAEYVSGTDNFEVGDIQTELELIRTTSRYFNSLTWVDETGYVHSIAPISVGLKGKTVNTGLTKVALDLRRPYSSEPYIAPSGRLIVMLTEPVYDRAGEYRGILIGSIYLQESNILYEILGNNVVDETGSYFYVTGPDGRILYHPDHARIGDNTDTNPVVHKLRDGLNGKQQVTNTKGIPMLAAYVSVHQNRWGVVQQTPVAAVHEKLTANLRQQVLYMLAPFLLLLLAVVFIARKLAHPFVSLADTVKQMSEGTYAPIAHTKPHWNREAELLTKTVIFAMEEMRKNNTQLIREASTDPLTELKNRRTMTDIMEGWFEARLRFSIVILDIDHFKSVNDTFGHPTGDEVLKSLAHVLSQSVRRSDICCRYGGEEFVLLFPGLHANEAFAQAERIRRKVERMATPIGRNVTISMGIAEYPCHAESMEALIDAADRAMYAAKQNGRNRTVVAISKEAAETVTQPEIGE
ncbi:sensor domain-containing diguanylate cyclase [Paenibacillus methanolicus]|uniref:Diguanylate cyclase (GGDEF)-like protein n=1 Tax=Paenibacillus methanolicus TaxID=582686 RepID=A0A5S5CJA5_9BACL|nr:sensor domain-containing diguanylate cyclase [Paenibacillus methanolicus]TYP78093.1 diguanylate cyclase (GGDEF)-like protein [Paenibacillus methanolicus]